jgi:AraC-like DNA-binding protein
MTNAGMDFSTTSTRPPYNAVVMRIASPTFGYWLRQAIGALAAVDHIACGEAGEAHWNTQPIRRQRGGDRRHPMGLHSDDSMEICMAVAGYGFIDIDTRRFRLRTPSLVAVPQGVAHSEGCLRHDRAYTAVWMWMRAKQMTLYVSQYQPRRGWRCPWFGKAPVAVSRRVGAWFNKERTLNQSWLERWRGELLAVLSHLHQKEIDRAARPRSPGGELGEDQLRVVEWVRGYLDRSYAQSVTLDHVAELAGYSPNYLDALYARWAGAGIRASLIQRRMDRAMTLVRRTTLPFGEIAGKVGYGDALYFSRAFRKYHGLSPTEARNDA